MGVLSRIFKGNQSRNNITRFSNDNTCPDVPRDFLDGELKSELLSLIEDILSVYNFSDDIGVHSVYLYEEMRIKDNTLNIREILLQSFLGNKQIISKIQLRNELTSSMFFVDNELDKDGLIDFGEDFGKIKPVKTVVIDNIFEPSTITLIKDNFCFLWNLIEFLKRQDEFKKKYIFKMHGFHALFVSAKTDEEQQILNDNKELVQSHYKGILEGSGGVIDAQDSIDLSSNDSRNDTDYLIQRFDFFNSQIARYLKIPITKLLGRPPQGMNATGEYDDNNYQQTLNRYRNIYIDPFLNLMEIPYEKINKVNIESLEKVVQVHIMAGIEISEPLEKKIQFLGESL